MSGLWDRLGTIAGQPVRRAFLAVPFVVPFVVHRLYQPINEAWTVKRFGCGCPPLDDRWRFNANYFNLTLWVIVLLACSVFFGSALRPEFPRRGPNTFFPVLLAGILLLTFMCMERWAKECWM